MKKLHFVIFAVNACIFLSACDSQKNSTNTSTNASINYGLCNKIKKDNEYTTAFSLYKEKKYQDSFEKMSKLAENGDMDAQLLVGSFYHRGYGTKIDLNLAEKWYLKSATQGCVVAQAALGRLYFVDEQTGSIKTTNVQAKQALFWLEKAANQNNTSAMTNLAMLYRSGLLGSADVTKEIFWLELAAKQGDSKAQYNLGRIFYTEKGFIDLEKSVFWLKKSANNGNVKAKALLQEINQ